MSKTRLGAGRGFFICFPQLACLFAFEVLSKLSPSLICGSSISTPRFDSSCERPHEGGQPNDLARVPVLIVLRFRDPGPLREHPSSTCPSSTATHTGPGSVAPYGWGQELFTCRHTAEKRES